VRRRLLALTLLLALIPSAPASAYGTKALATWMADDVVRAILRIGEITYIGGRFDHLVSHDGARIDRPHLAALDARGEPLPWNPGSVGNVSGLATDGTSLYVSGQFKQIAGHFQRYVAAFDLATGAFRDDWRPRPDAPVATMFVDALGQTIYVGGEFAAVGDVARERLAALSSVDGSVLPFDAGERKDGQNGDTVQGVVLARGRLMAVGEFVPHLQAFDPNTGALLPWQDRAPYRYTALATDGRNVYAGSGNGGGHVDAYRAVDGARLWSVRGDGNVQTIDVGPDGLIYAGGHYGRIEGVRREFLSVWTRGGVLRPYRLDFEPCCWGGVWAIDVTPEALLLGGRFDKVSGVIQRRYAELPA
jgi:putative pyrroloquinoline-quinone binding quinoprotein